MTDLGVFRVYNTDEIGSDGYPLAWHSVIKHQVRLDAGHRCVRCGHPYRNGEHGNGHWSPCDQHCTHIDGPGGTHAVWRPGQGGGAHRPAPGDDVAAWRAARLAEGMVVESAWRILTVHHLDGDKANCRWWNLAALCQRCHLTIQGRVIMARVWPWEHTEWFRPYVAGYYAHVYLGENLTRAQVNARLDELLNLERAA